jgi:hypothetical protein
MKVDPNQPVDVAHVSVLCHLGALVLFDDSRTPLAELDKPESPFQRFLQTLDPNRHFIQAYVPDDADRATFFRARDVAKASGIHMQASLDSPEALWQMWIRYQKMKQTPNAEGTSDGDSR